MAENQQDRSFWGAHTLTEGEIGTWQIGPLVVWIQRLRSELRIAYSTVGEAGGEANGEPADDSAPAVMDEKANLVRFVSRETVETITFLPALADRPIVSRPEIPFTLPKGEDVTVLVSTPLWLRIENGGGLLLQEIPIQRPSDTWFGPSTREGELCYATRTRCLLDAESYIHSPHRAITPVRIKNRAGDALFLERLNLPVVYLSLFETPEKTLWTQEVTMKREEDTETASMKIGEGPPRQAPKTTLLCGPRKVSERGMWIRAFSTLFG